MKREKWPWLAAIYNSDIIQIRFACAGTIVSKKVIVTVAHCIKHSPKKELSANDLVVYLGQNLLNIFQKYTAIVQPEYVKCHPDFDLEEYSSGADIALLILKSNILNISAQYAYGAVLVVITI